LNPYQKKWYKFEKKGKIENKKQEISKNIEIIIFFNVPLFEYIFRKNQCTCFELYEEFLVDFIIDTRVMQIFV